MIRTGGLVLALIVLSNGLPALAIGPPLLHGGGPTGWARGTIDAENESEMTFVLTLHHPREEAMLLLRTEFAEFGSHQTFSFTTDDPEVVVHSEAVGINVRKDARSSDLTGMELTVTFLCDACMDGEILFLVMAAGDASGWEWTLEGDFSASIAGARDGGTFFHDVSEFSGLATLTSPVYSGAIVAGSITKRTEGTIWALFRPPVAGVGTVLTPEGERSCYCQIGGLRGGTQAGPGEYVFRLSGAEAGHILPFGSHLYGVAMEP